MTDPAHLNARTVCLEAIFHLPLNSSVVAVFFHVDEVDDNEPSKVTQTQLARDLFSRFKIGFESCCFNVAFFS